MIDILNIEANLWVLVERGQNVLLKDAIRFGLGKGERKQLVWIISMVADALRKQTSLLPYIEQGYIKKLSHQTRTKHLEVWEARSPAGGRIIFIIEAPDTIIVSAVHKNEGSLSHAVNRGLKRWERLQKSPRKFPFQNC